MGKTIAVFGAGPGLGRSVARRFGREGYAVALVARTGARVRGFAAELTGAGIDAAGFACDLADRGALPGVVDAITDRFGPIDVLEYAPAGPVWLTAAVDIRDAGAASFELPLDLLLRTPAELVRLVLPGMLDRGHGALLFGLAASASRPYPQIGSVATITAAARAYLHNLHESLAGTGVYAGLLQVAALIEHSDAAEFLRARGAELPAALDPGVLADALWAQYTARTDVETTVSGTA